MSPCKVRGLGNSSQIKQEVLAASTYMYALPVVMNLPLMIINQGAYGCWKSLKMLEIVRGVFKV